MELTPHPIRPEDLIAQVRKDSHGATVTFITTVRSSSQGKEVCYLEFEAFPERARAELEGIAREIKSRWGLADIAISHRIGKVGVGEVVMAIAVAAPHHREAFAACQYALDRIRGIARPFKREIYR